MLKKNFPGTVNARRIKTLERLKETKQTGKTLVHKEELNEDNKKRVDTEIKILESKIRTSVEARGIRSKKNRNNDLWQK